MHDNALRVENGVFEVKSRNEFLVKKLDFSAVDTPADVGVVGMCLDGRRGMETWT
jgi:hypothetical protein